MYAHVLYLKLYNGEWERNSFDPVVISTINLTNNVQSMKAMPLNSKRVLQMNINNNNYRRDNEYH